MRNLPPAVSLPSVVSVIRGGGAVIDFDRSLVRLDAFSTYPVVAAILMSAMLDMNSDTPKVIKKIPDDADKSTAMQIKIENAATCLFAFICMFSIASAAYSVGVFSLVVIYSKTALGLGLDGPFSTFLAASTALRASAFRSTLSVMIGFLFSLSLSTFLREKGIIRWLESVPTFIISVLALVRFKYIMNLATTLIYS